MVVIMGLGDVLIITVKYFLDNIRVAFWGIYRSLSEYYSKILKRNFRFPNIGGEAGEKLKEYTKTGFDIFLSRIKDPEKLADVLDEGLKTAIALAVINYVLTQWYNNYIKYSNTVKCNGALPAQLAMANFHSILTELSAIEVFTKADEFLEFFMEGLGNVVGEILEKQLIGSLSVYSNLRYGSEKLDADDVQEVAESAVLCDKVIDYELSLSGAYNSSATLSKAKGRQILLEKFIEQIHSDIQYHSVKMWDTINYKADLISSFYQDLVKYAYIDCYDDLDSAINRYKNKLITVISIVDGILSDVENMSDDDWNLLQKRTKESYERQINHYITQIKEMYELDVLGTYQNIIDLQSKIQFMEDNLINKHNEVRKKIIEGLISDEQLIYMIVYNNLLNTYKNITNLRNGGSLSDYDNIKQNIK